MDCPWSIVCGVEGVRLTEIEDKLCGEDETELEHPLHAIVIATKNTAQQERILYISPSFFYRTNSTGIRAHGAIQKMEASPEDANGRGKNSLLASRRQKIKRNTQSL